MSSPSLQFPRKLRALFEPRRYKVLVGGRGGAKSWGIARALLIMAAQRPLRVLCARELQQSIKDSVHKLLSDQIEALGLGGFYDVLQANIKGRNGSEFAFAGLRHNVTQIKSFEGVDICWVEEAQTVSKASWDTLIPTIRSEGSDIWVSFNPELETDETYPRFVAKPPNGALVLQMNWSDNPWFPEVLRAEMEALKERDYDAYLTTWEGHCRQTLDGAVYAKEIRAATAETRITAVPYDRSKPVHTAWDLGRSDFTAIWFAQRIGFETHLIDYYEHSGEAIGHYLKELQSRPYVYGTHHLPHDAQAKQLGSKLSVEEQVKEAGLTVRIVPRLSVADGINAARTVFPNMWFDAEKCADGIQRLRHYCYDVDDNGQLSRNPRHDEASHAADAFRYLAVGLKEVTPRKKLPLPPAHSGGWMGRM